MTPEQQQFDVAEYIRDTATHFMDGLTTFEEMVQKVAKLAERAAQMALGNYLNQDN